MSGESHAKSCEFRISLARQWYFVWNDDRLKFRISF